MQPKDQPEDFQSSVPQTQQPQQPFSSQQINPQPITSPLNSTLVSEGKADTAGIISLICFSLFILGFFVPYLGLGGLPLLIVGTIAGFKTLKNSRDAASRHSAVVKTFRIIAIIGITIAGLFVVGIALLMYAIGSSGV